MDPKDYILNWLGAALVVLVAFAGIIGIMYVSSHYGNQLAKDCLKSGKEWVVRDSYHNQYECRSSHENR